MSQKIKIVVIDDDPQLLFATERMLKTAGYEVIKASGGVEGLQKVHDHKPDLVLLDVVMPDIDGREVCRQIKADPETAGTFVLLTSSLKVESNEQAMGLEAGADGYLARPIEKRELFARIEAMIRIRKLQNVCLEKETLYHLMFSEMISACAIHEMIFDANGLPSDYRFVDINPAFERMTGLTRAMVLGKMVFDILPETEKVWIEKYGQVVLSGEPAHFEDFAGALNKYFEVMAYKTQGNQFVVSFMDITEKKSIEEKLEFSALHDALTGLANRRLLTDRIEQSILNAQRYSQSFALLYLDLDNFKPVNDTFGHEAGDAVLQDAAKRLQRVIRASDTAARIGGDEFLVLLNNVDDAETAMHIAEKIRISLKTPISFAQTSLFIDVSIGMSIFPEDGSDAHQLIVKADKAMYTVKKLRHENI